MLLRFEVSNYRSILGSVELSMVAVDKDRPSVRNIPGLTEGVLAVAGIYGPNASGKSNVIESLAWLSNVVAESLQGSYQVIPRVPFKFGEGPHKRSTYQVDMVIGNVRYTYRLEVDDKVLFEGLYNYPKHRRRYLFEREGSDIRFRPGLGELSSARKLLTNTTLVLSVALRFGKSEVQDFARSLAGIGVIGLNRSLPSGRRLDPRVLGWLETLDLIFDRDTLMQSSLYEGPDIAKVSPRESALALLQFADLGIDDVQIVKDDIDQSQATPWTSRGAPGRLKVIHRASGQRLPFDFEEESAGTLAWFSLIGLTLRALRSGQILLFDEIDSSLHPRLTARLLELYQDPETNPHGAQLIFTTHDTSLLNHLNRDEVWFTEKNESGATTLTALAEYAGDRVRKSVNLERAYLRGRFGAVPELDQFLLRRALGLDRSDGK